MADTSKAAAGVTAASAAFPVLGLLGLGLQIAGNSRAKKEAKKAVRAEKKAAERAQEAAEFTAQQYEEKAGQERAIGSRDVIEQKRQGRITASNARAIGAASGAGGYESVIADIQGETDYQMLVSMYNNEQSARDLELAAEVSRREGADAARAHIASAGSYKSQGKIAGLQTGANILNSAASLYDNYGRGYGDTT